MRHPLRCRPKLTAASVGSQLIVRSQIRWLTRNQSCNSRYLLCGITIIVDCAEVATLRPRHANTLNDVANMHG